MGHKSHDSICDEADSKKWSMLRAWLVTVRNAAQAAGGLAGNTCSSFTSLGSILGSIYKMLYRCECRLC